MPSCPTPAATIPISSDRSSLSPAHPDGSTGITTRFNVAILKLCFRASADKACFLEGSGSAKCFRKNGERGGNRTYNLLIKSQLLCQLSYAPAPEFSLPSPLHPALQ